MTIEVRYLNYKIIALLLILAIMLAACVRPFTDEVEEGTALAADSLQDTGAELDLDGVDLDDEDIGGGPDLTVDEAENDENASEIEQIVTPEGSDEEGSGEETETEGVDDLTSAEVTEAAEDEAETEGEAGAEDGEATIQAGGDEAENGNSEQPPGQEQDSEASTNEETPAEMADQESAVEEPVAEIPVAEEPFAEEEEPGTEELQPRTHTVAEGENLYRIGLIYGLSWVVLAQYNDLTDADQISLGQVLLIPPAEDGEESQDDPEEPELEQSETDSEQSTTEIVYIVQQGEYLIQIAQAFGVSWQDIAQANGILNSDLVYPGQELIIPGVPAEEPAQITHVVQAGDTMNSIALNYGVSVEALALANNMTMPYILFVGQTIIIPGD